MSRTYLLYNAFLQAINFRLLAVHLGCQDCIRDLQLNE